jgi:uncharacterized membrane protein
MEQRSVTTQTAPQNAQDTKFNFRWMRHFFTEDVTPDNLPVVEIQHRALWIGLAFILQALNEITPALYQPYIQPVGTFVPFLLILGSLIAIWMGLRPTTHKQRTTSFRRPPRTWQRLLLIAVLLTTIAGGIEFGRATIMLFLPPQFSNDGTSLDTNAAILLSQGHNPYTDSNVLGLARQYSIEPNWTTPLRRGQFAGMLQYPSISEFRSVLDTDLKTGESIEFESRVSYPALSFLTLMPFAWLKTANVLSLYLASYLVLVFIAWKAVRPEIRPWVLLLSMANVPMWASTVGGNLDIFYTLLLVVAWLTRDRRGLSALFLGLAFASKQISWYFAPFYLIMIWRQYGLKEAIQRLVISGAVCLAINLPFILWNPQAFLAGVMAPVADPMFPMGSGLINLSLINLIPFLPTTVYTALEGIAAVICIAAYWKLAPKHPEAAMLLAVLPLYFAWRSLPSYFYCVGFPIFILMAAREVPRKQTKTVPGRQNITTLPVNSRSLLPTPQLPVAVSIQAKPLPFSSLHDITRGGRWLDQIKPSLQVDEPAWASMAEEETAIQTT